MQKIRLNHLFFTIVTGFFTLSINASEKQDISKQLTIIEDSIFYYPVQAKKALEKEFLPIPENHPYFGEVLYLKAFILYQEGEIDSSLKYIDEALYILVKEKNQKWQGRCHLLLGWIAERSGYWEEAIVQYFECIKFVINNKKLTGLSYLGIARCKKFLNEPFGKYLNTGRNLLYETNNKEFTLLSDFSRKIFDLRGTDTPGYLNRIANSYLDLGLNSNALAVYKKIGEYYFHKKKLDSTHYYLDLAVSLYDEKFPGVSLLPNLTQFKGGVYFLQKDYRKAKKYYLKTIKLCNKYGQENFKFYPLKFLSKIDTLNGDYEKAFNRISLANEIKQKTNIKEKQRMAEIAETTAKVRNLENQIFLLKTKNKIKSITFWGIGLISLLAGAFLFYWIKIKAKEKQERINKKNRELQNLIISLNEKKLIHINKKEFSLESIEITNSLNGENLKEQFDICYFENIALFKKIFPSLSKVEATYAFMFALKLSPELIAEIQCIQISTIRKVKQRIRQKLELTKDCDLEIHFFHYYQKFFS